MLEQIIFLDGLDRDEQDDEDDSDGEGEDGLDGGEVPQQKIPLEIIREYI